MKFATSILAGLALASSATAHLFLQSPKPIAGSDVKKPLEKDGSDFPCHGVAAPTSGGINMAVGSIQNLTFDEGKDHGNTAVHGGGSCQISITYATSEAEFKDPKNWKVLYSIVGGCPTNSPMNLEGAHAVSESQSYSGSWQCSDPSTNGYDCVNSFPFAIPKEVKNGQATLGWTWFNNVGNREMYMNCISVDITGGHSDDSALNTLPNLFVANVPKYSDTCASTEGSNLVFPDPGNYVTTKHAAFPTYKAPGVVYKEYPFALPTGCGAAKSSGGSGGSSSGGDAAAPAPAPAPALAPAPAVSTTFATSAAAATEARTALIRRPIVDATQTAAAPAAGSTGTGSSSGTPPASGSAAGSGADGRVACSSPGTIVCIGQSKFGICDISGFAVAQSVAAGTACIDGKITFAPKVRARRHLARHNFRRNAHQHA